jgi:hypothetical protein
VPIQLELRADGSNLTGALTRNRRSSPITRGRITPEGLAFTARLGRQMEDFSGSYRAGQRIYVTLDNAGVTAPLTAVTFRREASQR